jgi:glutamate dehydrogenase (NADP+)
VSRKPAVKSLVGFDVHGKANTHVKNPDVMTRPLFRRGGVDSKFTSGSEVPALINKETLRRDPGLPLFRRSVSDVANSLVPLIDIYPKMAWILKSLVEPEHVIQFQVPWTDDGGNTRINRGFRVQHSSVLGPYSGGLSFNEGVDSNSLRAHAFEQTFQNSLVGGLRLGGARGGADFSADNKSKSEIKAFSQSFIMELARYIGQNKDHVSGGNGVGEREIGFMFGRYKRRTRSDVKALSGDVVVNDLASDVSLNRERATGTGAVMFAKRMIEAEGGSFENKKCAITGSGNIALAIARALIDVGAIPITLSDAKGFVYESSGFTREMLEQVERANKTSVFGNNPLTEYIKKSATW